MASSSVGASGHILTSPVTDGVKLSDDETENKVKPVRVAYIAPGPTHTAAVVSTHSNTSNTSEFFYGHDVLWWGNNEFYQLGNGKRNNMCIPSYIAPLDSSPIDIENVEKPLGQAPQHRLQVTPKARTVLGDGRKLEVEQRVITGKGVSGVYSKVS